MVDFLLGVLALILRAVNFVLDMQRLARLFTGSDAIVEVPPEPKVLPQAAQRALAEAEQRHHDGASFIDKYVSPSCK